MANYHIKPNGDPGICSAHIRDCKYKLSADEHYGSPEEAQQAYEKQQEEKNVSMSLTKKLLKKEKNNVQEVNSSEVFSDEQSTSDVSMMMNDEYDVNNDPDFIPGEYYFDVKSDDYGIPFLAPDHSGVYEEANDDGSVFYRFEQLDELFDEFDDNDVYDGYSMNVPLNTVQQYVSPELVAEYAQNDDFNSTKFHEDENHPASLARVLVHKGELYIIDGNHRFMAGRLSGRQTFKGVVIGMNDEMTNMWTVPPEYFNKMFEQKMSA